MQEIIWDYVGLHMGFIFDLFVRLNEMHIDRHIDKCIDNETDMLPGVETEIQSEVGTDFDKEFYSRDNSVNDLGDDVTARYWILFESNKKTQQTVLGCFWRFGRGGQKCNSEGQFRRVLDQNKTNQKINVKLSDKLSVKLSDKLIDKLSDNQRQNNPLIKPTFKPPIQTKPNVSS